MPTIKKVFGQVGSLFRRAGSNKDEAAGPGPRPASPQIQIPEQQPSLAQPVETSTATPLSQPSLTEIPPPTEQQTLPVQTSSHEAPERGNDRYGLFPMNLNAQGLATTERTTVANGSAQIYPIDVVAVHGITGDAYHTWTHSNNKRLWLRDFLNDDLPGARIFSYGYDASVFFTLNKGGLEDFAQTLLGHIKQTRTTEVGYFICL
jgi:hypothetical protein